MCLGIVRRTAWLVGLTLATAVFVPGSSVAQSIDETHPLQMSEPIEPDFAATTDLEPNPSDVLFAQLQPPADEPRRSQPPVTPEPAPRDEPAQPPRPARTEPAPRDLLARFEARRRRPLATVPYMFGDFFGGGGGQAVVTFPPITAVLTDGAFDLFVTNAGGTDGANINPAVPITIRNGPGGALVSGSIGNGIDLSGDGQPDAYPVSSPNAPGFLPPPVPCPGTLTYTGGNAVFADAAGNPIDGSVGQGDGWSLVANYVCVPNQVVLNVPYGGAAVRRFKISEHASPEPRCRVFFDYNFYNDVFSGLGDVSRYTFGYEHAFFGGMSSIEVRVPFAATLDNEQTSPGVGGRDIEFGNLAAWYKVVLYEIPTGLISAGLGVTVPTGSSSRVLIGPTPILEIENQSVHLLPFVAAMSTPRDRWFWQAFMQFDVAANGNPARGDVSGQNLTQFGVLNDATLLFLDAAVGYSLYESDDACGLTRVSPTAELHYSTTLQDADVAAGNGFVISSPTRRFDVLNLTLGVSFLWHDRLWIRPAMVIPLRDDDDKHFDYEAMVQIDWSL